ncbi:POU domain, class 6, transcription factor 1 [Schistosoma japonicum]|nr:POU domain, class 6, transcription factor 1 [Schistosoma japonicum]
MALDLSSVNDTCFEDTGSNTVYNCVFLSSEVISLPGTTDILFYISEVGHLVLANFFVEHSSGSYILKKLPSIKFPHDSSCMPTNLSLDKSFSNQEDAVSQPALNSCSDVLDLNFHNRFGRTETDLQSSALDCTNVCHAQMCSQQTAANASLVPTSLNVPDFEHPVDTTVPRSQCRWNSMVMNNNENSPSCVSRSKFLGQIVCELLNKIKNHMNSSESQEIIIQGHNLSELERFVKHLREFRLRLGLSQVQLSTELEKHYNDKALFSQTLLSRFEKLNVTVRSAYRLLPYLKRWISHAEQNQCSQIAIEKLSVFRHPVPVRAVGNSRLTTLARLGQIDHTPFSSSSSSSSTSPVLALVKKHAKDNGKINRPSVNTSISKSILSSISQVKCKLTDPQQKRCRRRRTYFSPKALSILTEFYAVNSRPKVIEFVSLNFSLNLFLKQYYCLNLIIGPDFTELASRIGCDRESVRVWFCNRRQLDQECSKKDMTASTDV